MRASASDVGKFEVNVQTAGLFPRLATTCFLRSGYPTPFTQLVTYSRIPLQYTGPGELLEHFGKEPLGVFRRSITLHELMEFDYAAHLKDVRTRHGFHKFDGLPDTAFLVDVLTLFLASVLARYHILDWRDILDGESNSYRLGFDAAFERIRSFTVGRIVTMLSDAQVRFGDHTSPTQPSPYSHRDKRFGGDPNC